MTTNTTTTHRTHTTSTGQVGSYVSQTGPPAPNLQHVNTYGPCPPGYTALSGGMYLSKPDGK